MATAKPTQTVVWSFSSLVKKCARMEVRMGAIATMMLTLAAKVCFRAVFSVKK